MRLRYAERPRRKDVFVALMDFEIKDILALEKSTGCLVEEEYLMYRCQNPTCQVLVIEFLDKSDFKNLY